MKVSFSKDSKEFLFKTKDFIANDNPATAKKYIQNLIRRIVNMLQFPNIGKINFVFDDSSIREITIEGFKVIYKKYPKSVVVLMIYKYIDFDESELNGTGGNLDKL